MNFKIREESTQDLSVFMNLPPELQVQILSFLPKSDLVSVSRSCHYLSALAKDQSLWTTIKFDFKDVKFYKNMMKSERFNKLKHIEVTNKTNRHGHDVVNIDGILNTKTLTSIKLQRNIILEDSSLAKISQTTSLTSMDISCFRITPSTLTGFSRLLNLKVLKMYDLDQFESKDLENLFSTFKNLKIVEVPSSKIEDRAVATLVRNNTNLNHLVIDHCKNVSSAIVMILARSCPNLQHISMRKCDGVRETDVLHLLSSFPHLRHVGLSRITNKTLIKLLKDCPNIESVSLEYCWVTEKGITELLTSAKRLRNLELVYNTILQVGNNFDEKFKNKNPGSRVKIRVSERPRPLYRTY